jgi:hypothetical protein
MPYTAKTDLASPFGTFRAGTTVDEGAVPGAVLAAWAEAGAIETAIDAAPEAAVTETPETAVAAAPETRARTRKTR